MTIQELIQKLSQYDPNTRVIVRGYEDGFNDVNYTEQRKIVLNYHSEWYYGSHQDADRIVNEDNSYEVVNAVLIS